MSHSGRPNVLFIQTVNPGVGFYRMFQFAYKMSELGLANCRIFPDFEPLRLEPPDWESEERLKKNLHEIEAQADWSDIIIVQYVCSPGGFSVVQALKETRPVLMELDDYFKQVPYQSQAYDYNRPGDYADIWATRQLMESTAVIVSTPWLAKELSVYNKKIAVMPNCINFDIWDPIVKEPHDLLRVGWVGGATHSLDLRIVRDACFHLLDSYPGLQVCIASAPPPTKDWPTHDRLMLVNEWAAIDKYPEFVKKKLSFDIGIVPLRDNLFNRGKSNLRALEYAACKIPVVTSFVEPFKNGLPSMNARSTTEWVDTISKLVESEELRQSYGEDVYNYVKENYNVNKIAFDYFHNLEQYL